MLDYARTWLALRFDKRGVTAMEYGLIAALDCRSDHHGGHNIGQSLKTVFETIQNALAA